MSLVPILLGMVLHEVAHGWVAWKMGDPTAKMQGRLTINPIPHLDPVGTLFFVVTAIMSAGTTIKFIFGWAKPVPINPRLFRSIRQGVFATAIAGATANLLLALGFTLLLRFLQFFYGLRGLPPVGQYFLVDMSLSGIWINTTLAWFNLMPIPPLDGSKVLASVLPDQAANAYLRLGRYGMFIVVILLATGWLWKIMRPLLVGTFDLFMRLAQLF